MLVKCKACGEKIDRNIAFKVVIKEKNQYYCTEKEFKDLEKEKNARVDSLKVAKEILGDTTNTVLFKEFSSIAKVHSYCKILQYLNDNFDTLKKTMLKSFSNEFGKIKYFITIIKNNIGDYILNEKEDDLRNVDIEIVEVKYKQKDRKKSLNQYIEEYLKGE